MQNEGSRCGERVVSNKVRGYSKFDYGRIECCWLREKRGRFFLFVWEEEGEEV